VLLAFRHLPIPSHRFALEAAEAAFCAGADGKFWEMHDQLFTHQRELAEGDAPALARTLNLQRPRFDRCMAEDAVSAIKFDVDQAKTLLVTSTPTFFLGVATGNQQMKVEERLVGAHPEEEFVQVLDQLLQRRDASR
jgi:protein-disulfide isomerase